ncbi:competence/damage-inducible protein A [Prochlorococcus sp. MIT 1341]|uniref:competence/damage-inducible protein A n=1 Tax=Prochlorococcus sp. MIT 1341 TaxID=3096221 RepID=UPI002A7601A2|nr:competence/damage-inducible protein A [Prochlorococcus sp. MIT 1341]
MIGATENATEILCIGTELLLGNILNSNSSWLSEQIALLGLPHYRQSVIGDNEERLIETINEASSRCRILITTGGLGPTQDDITFSSLAKAFNAKLEENKKVWEEIKRKEFSKHKEISTTSRKQAFVPKGSEIIPNKHGTAPGIIFTPKDNFTVICLPGVPYEMREMWSTSVTRWLQKNLSLSTKLESTFLNFAGISEPKLAEIVADLMDQENPSVAPYASLGDIKLRITARSQTSGQSQQLLLPIEKEILSRTGSLCYGKGEETLASVALQLLRVRDQTLSVAESCTGGKLGAALTEIKGASENFVGGIIAYSNQTKKDLLGVHHQLLEKHGAVSKEVALSMAKGLKKKIKSDWAISITGIAGPDGGTQSKPIGTVFIAIIGPNCCQVSQEKFGEHTGRKGIQTLSVVRSLDLFRLTLHSQS